MKTNLLILTIYLLTLTIAHGQTNVSGGTVSGTWTLAGSPYLIQGSIMVPNDSTLTIQPGVTINFQGHYKLLVLGRLLSIGTVTDSIIFTATNTTSGWYGIRFDNTPAANDSSKVIYCSLQWGNANGTGKDIKGGAIFFNHVSKAIVSRSRIENNYAHHGGGIACDSSSSPVITNNTISNNTAAYGGGICLLNYCSPLISGNTISSNGFNSGSGTGAIYILSGNPVISNNNITNNGAGGIFNYGGNSIISNNIISSNSGGIGCQFGNPIINNNTITLNTGNNYTFDGGGISCLGSNATIYNNIISNNSTTSSGGGIYLESSQNIFNNTITNNTASDGGGGIYCRGNVSTFTNNTISNNIATNGGALYCEFTASPVFRNCIIYGNTASTSGAQVFLNDEPSDPKFYYSNIQGGSAAFDANGNFYTGTYQNNVNSNPTFVSPSAGSGTAFNGVTANWSLQTGSPCIDAGDPLGFYSSTDLAGNPRLENVSSCAIDMGAYEFQSVLCPNNGITSIANDKINIQIFPNPFSIQTALQIDDFLHNATLSVDNCFGQTVCLVLIRVYTLKRVKHEKTNQNNR